MFIELKMDKILKAITEIASPLYKEWKENCNLTDEEAVVVYHKLFNPKKPTNEEIAEIIHWDIRTVSRRYKSARNKIFKYLP